MPRMQEVPSPTAGGSPPSGTIAGGPSDAIPSNRCYQCHATGVPLLACDDPDVMANYKASPSSKPRFCNNCMIGKRVKVFWPVDESWYTGVVQQYDVATGEHLLRYHDGDTEWVKIGESNTTNMGNVASAPPNHRSPPAANSVPGDRSSSSADAGGAGPAGTGGPTGGPPPPLHASAAGGYYGGPYPGGPYPSGGMPPHAYGVHPASYGMYTGAPHPHHPYSSHHPGGPYAPHHGVPPPHHHPHYGVSEMPSGGPSTSGDIYKNDLDGGGASQSSDQAGGGGGLGRRKSGPKAWTKEEDALLLKIVHSMQWPMKWTVVSQNLPGRTGKQCRERYVNHLNPRLKVTDWNPVEDATVFYLYNAMGSHWAKMAKVIPGRTDNGIKNRFHNIRRQYEREDEHRLRLSSANEFPDEVRLDRVRPFPNNLKGKTMELWNMQSAIPILAGQGVVGEASGRNAGSNSYRFGPFREGRPGDICIRCGFLIPSVQTGRLVCTKTRWCHACSRIPPHIAGNLLRECLTLRREQDMDLRSVIESWEELFAIQDDALDNNRADKSAK